MENLLRIELSLADPREGGGDLSMTTMISENIVDVVEKFCDLAKSATSGASEKKLLREKGSPTEELLHDIKVAGVLVRDYVVHFIDLTLILSLAFGLCIYFFS